MLAHQEAAEHYARALDVLDRFDPDALERRCELLLLLGEAWCGAASGRTAWPTFRRGRRLAERLGDSAALARAAIGASRRYVQQPGVVDDELIALLERALETTADERDGHPGPAAGTAVRRALLLAPDRDRMQPLSDEATALARELGDPEATAYACGGAAPRAGDPAHLERTTGRSTEMLTLRPQAGRPRARAPGPRLAGRSTCSSAATATPSTRRWRRSRPAPSGCASRCSRWHAIVWRAMRALLAGDLDRAEELAADALAAGAPGGRSPPTSTTPSSCWRSGASRQRWTRWRRPPVSSSRQPRPAGLARRRWRLRCMRPAATRRPSSSSTRSPRRASTTSPTTATG